MDDSYRTDKLSTGMGENYVICIAPINENLSQVISDA